MSEKTAEVSFEELKKAGMIQSPQTGAEKPPPNFVYKRELGNGGMGIVYEGIGKIHSYWEGARETALYLYGSSAETMRERIADFMAEYPLCERARYDIVA